MITPDAASASRVLISEDPYLHLDEGRAWNKRGLWPCRWIGCPGVAAPPFVTVYRKIVKLHADTVLRVHVTADERYELFLDGERIGRGSERGDTDHWFFETYEIPLMVGPHVFVARVWTMGFDRSPYAQMTVTPGFLFSPDTDEQIALLGTGVADWEAKPLGGYAFTDPSAAWGTGANVVIDGAAFDWGWERGEGDGWQPAVVRHPGANGARLNDISGYHRLRPATLPAMLDAPRQVGTVRHVAALSADVTETHSLPIRAADDLPDERAAWNALIKGRGEPLTIPAHTRRRILLDLDDYYCAYPEVVTSGGAGGRVRIHWQECLFDDPKAKAKGDRDAIAGKYFVTIWHLKDGIGDTFLPDGGANRRFDTLWWQAGRYIEILAETAEEPLTLERFTLRETRYPLENESRFAASDDRLEPVIPLCVRTLQTCAHETYMDCPYYEQLMYIGDTRLEALITYVISHDDRLPRKALTTFDASRLVSGLTQSRWPSRVRQVIPAFSLWWVAMVADYAEWRDDPGFVCGLIPGVRGVLDHYLSLIGAADGLLHAPEGWNTMDWVPGWSGGIPPDGQDGISGVMNAQLVWALTLAARLEESHGEPEPAARLRRHGDSLYRHVAGAFWSEERGLFADDLAMTRFSEHTQCLLLLSGKVEDARKGRVAAGLLTAPDLARTTIYFTHYLFETLCLLGRTDVLIERMGLWFDLEKRGLKTTVEMPEPTRSDCHAWGAHPLFHYFATILGIRPAGSGFAQVEITPQLGPLSWARGTMRHPKGEITVDLKRLESGVVEADIRLPEGVKGILRLNGGRVNLTGGHQVLRVSPSLREGAAA